MSDVRAAEQSAEGRTKFTSSAARTAAHKSSCCLARFSSVDFKGTLPHANLIEIHVAEGFHWQTFRAGRRVCVHRLELLLLSSSRVPHAGADRESGECIAIGCTWHYYLKNGCAH